MIQSIRYLADFTGERKERVSVRHLLAHTSGLLQEMVCRGPRRATC